ncbi:aldehyde dehydrogenase family protein, partial [Saezia sanguinis]|uniref:aldehyde dehydrogenase family protein n=2 Tax=Bacteria TaxID=2 RepID=UPI000F8D21D8
ACTAANRFHVQRGVLAEFTDKFAAAMKEQVRMGPGTDPETTLGPLINSEQLSTVSELVDDAVSAGATVRLGGKAPGGPGWF